MRRKTFFLVAILIAPIGFITFLYLFGQNKYAVKPNLKLPQHAPIHTLRAIGPQNGPVVVGLADSSSAPAWMQTRVQERLDRIAASGGKIAFDYLVAQPAVLQATGSARRVPCSRAVLQNILTQDLGFKADTGGVGYWYLLLDTKGRLLNAYDMRQERMLDSLAIEATIVGGGK